MIRKVFFFLLIIFLTNCSSQGNETEEALNFPLQLQFSGIGSTGIFDPSVTLDTSTNTLWMSYSEVHPSVMWPEANPEVVSTRLAHSTDNGKTWTDSGIYLSRAYDVTVSTPDPEIYEGTWMSEVPQLLYDQWETDDNKKWKLFWHHYLRLDHVALTATGQDSRLFQHGWIGVKEASSAAGLSTAAEIKLFAAGSYDPVNNDTSGATNSPVGGVPVIEYHNDIDPALGSCFVLSEPGFLATEDGIYMSIVSFEASGNNNIQLLKCSRPCDVQDSGQWSYLGTMLTNTEASAMGYNTFSATELYAKDGKTYLMVSPVTDDPWPGSYNGCVTFRFTDFETAMLEGSPTVIDFIQGDEGSFNGACEYHTSLSYGFMYGQVYQGEDEMFRLFHSGIGQ